MVWGWRWNLLGRFDTEAAPENTMEQSFFTCADLIGAEKLFAKAAEKTYIGTSLIVDRDQVYGLGLALEKDEIYYLPAEGLMTGDYLCGKLSDLGNHVRISAMDIKALLKHTDLKDTLQVFDMGIGAYLLNPLKSSYYKSFVKTYRS